MRLIAMIFRPWINQNLIEKVIREKYLYNFELLSLAEFIAFDKHKYKKKKPFMINEGAKI